MAWDPISKLFWSWFAGITAADAYRQHQEHKHHASGQCDCPHIMDTENGVHQLPADVKARLLRALMSDRPELGERYREMHRTGDNEAKKVLTREMLDEIQLLHDSGALGV